MAVEDELRSAGATIGDMPATDVDRRLRQLKERRESRSSLTELGQLAELDSAEIELAAYELACRYRDDGNLAAAVSWFAKAADADFCDASLELAKVLDQLAGGHPGGPASPASSREELDLVSRAARWYGTAFAAGHPEAADLLDALIARHDPRRQRTASPAGGHVDQRAGQGGGCSLGGLTEVMRCQLTTASVHIGTCRPCQLELLEHGGILPAVHRNLARGNRRAGRPDRAG